MKPVALITGGARGIGRGIALELARHGHDVVINDVRDSESAACLNALQEAGNGTRAEFCQGDVASDADRRNLIAFTRDRFGRLDVLVNNAGISSIGRRDILCAREEDFDALMAVNLKGPYFLTQLAARWMIDQRTAGTLAAWQLAKIINISSVSADAASTDRGDYCISKAALTMMTRLYAARLAAHGINVYEIRPGVIASDMTAPVKDKYTRMFAQGFTPICRWGTPEDVAKAVAAIALDLLPYSTGETLNVDGGFHVQQL
jgi:3-oxoacyl-[acyl-carrier protein] reductase